MRNSLSIKLAILLVTITTVIMISFIGIRFGYNWYDFHNEMNAKFERISSRISATVNPTIWDIYKKSVDRTYSEGIATAILDAELQDPYLIAIKVYGNFGHLFMGKIKLANGTIIDFQSDKHDSFLSAADRKLKHPIKIDQMTIGNVEAYFTEKPLTERLFKTLLLEIIQTILVGFSVILFLFYALRISLVKPLVALQTAKHAIDSMSDGIVIFTPEGQVIEVNNAYIEQTGYAFHEVEQKKLNLFKRNNPLRDHGSDIWGKVEDNGHWAGELDAEKKDGNHYPAMVSITTVLDDQKQIINRVMLIRDITSDHTLQQSQRMETVGALAGGIAHDINNVLTPIMGWAEVLTEELQKNTTSHHGAVQILKGADRAKKMIDQIMNFSRMTNIKELHDFDVKSLILNTVKFIRPTFPASIHIETLLSDGDLIVNGDPGKTEQALINIFTNAMHAMEEHGGTLSISAKIESKHEETESTQFPLIFPKIHIVISDTGHGIPKEMCDKIFEPYFTTKGSGKGNGFGLSTSLGIITNMNGELQVESSLNQGATFHIWLPYSGDVAELKKSNYLAPKAEAIAESETYSCDELIDVRVMLVDDESDNLRLLENMLDRFGCITTSFHNPIEAATIFETHPDKFDFLITDQSMPLLQGHELVTQVKLISPDIPVVIISGHPLEDIKPKYEVHHGIQFIRKPFNIAEIKKSMRTSLELMAARNKPFNVASN